MAKESTQGSESSICEFYCCYLLRSLKEEYRNHVYIGTTPNPIRRLRQHNRELTMGAIKTGPKGPWEYVLLVYGFPSARAALQFEWNWQKQNTRHFDSPSKKKRGAYLLSSKLETLRKLLNFVYFKKWPLKLRIVTDENLSVDFTKLPQHMLVTCGPTKDMPFSFTDNGVGRATLQKKQWEVYKFHQKNNTLCKVCQKDVLNEADEYLTCTRSTCRMAAHIFCLAKLFLENNPTCCLPTSGVCPICKESLRWGDLIYQKLERQKRVDAQLAYKEVIKKTKKEDDEKESF
ncbi:hypothetical protein G9A89_023935 [Geosiphon pyriformis]|nr:hypothetical protein G9A89_023935 [Geosiphon pyriformis]